MAAGREKDSPGDFRKACYDIEYMKKAIPAPLSRRTLAEAGLLRMLLPFGISYVGVVLYIYEEDSERSLPKLLEWLKSELPPNATDDDFMSLAVAVGEAWNYFPHARLDGDCPGDVMQRSVSSTQKKRRTQRRKCIS